MAKNRSLKVISQGGYNHNETPTIILKGQWLKEVGFDIGDYVSVSCENGKLVFTPDTERVAMEAAEAAFMEKEKASSKKKFKVEKEKLHAQFLAEQSAGCASDESKKADSKNQ